MTTPTKELSWLRKISKGAWKKSIRKLYREWQIGKTYGRRRTIGDESEDGKPQIILVLNHQVQHGGLVDRLKGIVSCYAIAKELGMGFSVYTNKEQFDLFKYLIPAQPAMVCEPNGFICQKGVAKPLYLNDWIPQQKQQLLREFKGRYRQFHVYTNQDFTWCFRENGPAKANEEYAWTRLFHELFSFSPALRSEAEKHLAPGQSTVAIHARFLSALGDFRDVEFKPLPDHEKKTLVESCLTAVKRIAFAHPANWILVVSDSSVFLNAVRQLARDEGFDNRLIADAQHIGHIDFVQDDRVLLKTALDFYLLCRSKSIYQLRMPFMYSSQFSKYASYIAGCDLVVVSS